MDSERIYNTLMGKYLTLIENKQYLMDAQIHLSDCICDLQNAYNRSVSNNGSKNALVKRKKMIMNRIANYKQNELKIKKLSEEITDMGKRVYNFNTEKKKVKFLIPNTDSFNELKHKYVDETMYIMC